MVITSQADEVFVHIFSGIYRRIKSRYHETGQYVDDRQVASALCDHKVAILDERMVMIHKNFEIKEEDK